MLKSPIVDYSTGILLIVSNRFIGNYGIMLDIDENNYDYLH